jgi:hypothetical protein
MDEHERTQAELAHEHGDHSLCGEHAACFLVWHAKREARMEAQRRLRVELARLSADGGVRMPVPLSGAEDPPPGFYRVGNKNARNIYLHVDGFDVHVGCMFDPADGPLVVEALNAYLERGENVD